MRLPRTGNDSLRLHTVKLLFDQNLSPRLVRRLADLHPGSTHVFSLGIDRASDDDVWERAREDGYRIADMVTFERRMGNYAKQACRALGCLIKAV